MKQLHLGSQTICYEEFGAGPAVLLIHSFPHDHRVWQLQAEALSDDFRVITPDLPGFGASPRMKNFGVESAATLLLAMIDHLELPSVIVGGISMGGYVSLAIASRLNSKVTGLILADTKAAADTPDARLKRSDLIDLVRNGGASHVIGQLLPTQLASDVAAHRPQALHNLRNIMQSQTPEALAAGMMALRDRPDYTATLSTIEIPTLLLYGENDQITPPGTAEQLAASLKHPTIRRIADAGHISSIDQPERVTAALREFLVSVRDGSSRTIISP